MAIQVTIKMKSGGVMSGTLNPEMAPNTVKNFVHLANRGFYDGLKFHRVIQGFMIQGGCPQGTGTGGPGYNIRGEFRSNGYTTNTLKHQRGVLSMARAMSPNSAGSHFFVMHAEAPHLDGQYAAFGQIETGLEVLDAIAQSQTDFRDAPLEPQIIESIRCTGEGCENPEEPEKV